MSETFFFFFSKLEISGSKMAERFFLPHSKEKGQIWGFLFLLNPKIFIFSYKDCHFFCLDIFFEQKALLVMTFDFREKH